MRFELGRHPGFSFVMFLFTCAWIVALAVLLDITEIFGISFQWRWSFVDSGHSVVRAFTPKITNYDRTVFLVEGEELVVDYDYRPDSDRPERAWVNVSVFTYDGWVPGLRDLEFFHQDLGIRSKKRGELHVTAPRSQLYKVSCDLMKVKGEFEVDWRVENPATQGRLARLFTRVTGLGPVGLVLVIVAVVTCFGARKIWPR